MNIRKMLLMVYEAPDFLYNKILFQYKKVEYGSNLTINGRIIIKNHGTITIGNDFKCNSKDTANPVGGPYRSVLYTLSGAKITIGDGVGISGSAIIARENISIGNNVLVGSGCCIYDNDFHDLNAENRKRKKERIETKPVRIGDNVFIGARSIILKGVQIGENSVIGAGSVVTKSVPPNEIWAGNPAHFIKRIMSQSEDTISTPGDRR